jgi:uncharacterized protein YecE (DUF72 family)
MHWHLGTMGFSYSEWSGVFYPRGTKPGDYLAHYARHFDALELDTTFHAVPPVERVRRWADATPAEFRFCAKTPRAVTHDASLDRGVLPMLQFLDVMRGLGEKLAVVLLQFPPTFTAREAPRIDEFLGQMPSDVRFAAEFRHPSWRAERTAEILSQHRVAWVAVDFEGELAEIRPTTDFLYVRWIGAHNRFEEKDREQLDMTERLEWWRDRIAAAGVPTVYGFFNNDYSGYSIATCNRFKQVAGVPHRQTLEAQPTLF